MLRDDKNLLWDSIQKSVAQGFGLLAIASGFTGLHRRLHDGLRHHRGHGAYWSWHGRLAPGSKLRRRRLVNGYGWPWVGGRPWTDRRFLLGENFLRFAWLRA